MLIESLLSHISARLARRYLTFDTRRPSSPPEPDPTKSYLLYVHIPFCEELCPYCSFVRIKLDRALASRYFAALKKEIRTYADLGYRFDSVYVGGGTPTIIPDELAAIVSHVRELWPITQLSIETNPNHLVPSTLDILKQLGTNRLSVGVQSFNDTVLEIIQRREKYGSAAEIKDRLSSVVGMFETLNVDLMFNYPNQTERMVAEDIAAVKEVDPGQITYYPLMLSRADRAELVGGSDGNGYAHERRLYELLVRELADTYKQESVWCFSKKKGLVDEYIIDHGEYAGVGPGSCGYVGGVLYFNTFSVEQYVDMVQARKSPIIGCRHFSLGERTRYRFLLKLLQGRTSVSEMRAECGRGSWFSLAGPLLFLLATGALTLRGGTMTLTATGRYYWLILMRTILTVVGDYRRDQGYGNSASAADPPAQE